MHASKYKTVHEHQCLFWKSTAGKVMHKDVILEVNGLLTTGTATYTRLNAETLMLSLAQVCKF